jgi:hypothetical protein
VLARARELLEAHPRMGAAAACLACLLVGALCGHACMPARVRVVTKEVAVEKVRTVEVEKRVEVAAKASSGGLVVHRVVVRRITPKGVALERTTEDLREGHQAQENVTVAQEKQAVRVEYRERVTEKVLERTAAKPQWRVGVLAGLDVPSVVRGGLAKPPWAVGGVVERRVLGPFSLGLWGLSSGTAGLAATVEW